MATVVQRSARRGWVDRAVHRRYDRAGARGVLVLYLKTVVPLGIAWYFLTAQLGSAVLNASPMSQFWHTVVWLPVFLTLFVITLVRGRADLRAVLAWRGDRRSADSAPDAWAALQRLPRLVLTFAYLCVPIAPFGAIDLVVRHHLSWWLAAPLSVSILANYASLFVLFYFTAELVLRPVREDVAVHLADDIAPLQGASLGLKLLTPIPAIALLAAMIVAAFGDQAQTVPARVTIVCGAALGAAAVATALFLLVQRVTLAPLGDLQAATLRVRSGDFATRVPALSTDEFGALARSFNLMLDGLREREDLREELRASRTRIVVASDAERRRIERNIHDGAQQQLVALSVKLRLLEDRLDDSGLKAEVQMLRERLRAALADLRELARGLHPSILASDGLQPAIDHLAGRAPMTVDVIAPDVRFPELVESTAYFVVSEALANVTKHAQATAASVRVSANDGHLLVAVTDDGIGGARAEVGSGLAGLADRVAAVDGHLTITSPTGCGTHLVADLPL